jgi:hypothetical protein
LKRLGYLAGGGNVAGGHRVDGTGSGSYPEAVVGNPVGETMRISLIGLGFAAACLLAAQAAHAFTVENKDTEGQYGVPKFDLEQQAKDFTKDGINAPGGKTLYETPIAGGTLQFGVSPGTGFGSGSPFSSQLGPSLSTDNARQEFDRRLAPPTSMEFNSPR